MKESLGFICDSSADFPPGLVEELGVHVLPVHILVDNKDYLHGHTINNNEVIKALKNKREVYTKPFFPHECQEILRQLLKRYEEVIFLHVSSHLSDIYKSARMGLNLLSDEEKEKIHLIDLKTASIHMGQSVKKAIQYMRSSSGQSLNDLKSKLSSDRRNSFMGFTVDSLYWLRKGGRISALQSLVGGILNIKPTIVLENDRLQPKERHSGKKPALKNLVEMSAEVSRRLSNNCDIWLGYTDNLDEVMFTREKLATIIDRKVENMKLIQIGATISAHTGPGCVGISIMDNN